MLKVTKYSFMQSEFKLLGHFVNKTAVKVDNGEIKETLKAPRPSNVTEIGSFRGFSYYKDALE